MPIPTELVGSLPRAQALQDAFKAHDEGRLSLEALMEEQEKAAKDSIERLEATGETYVTDGEQRASSFATYPINDTAAGTGLVDTMGGGGQYFAFFDDGHDRQLPRLVKGPFKYKNYAFDHVKLSAPLAKGKYKKAVISPSMLYLTYPLTEEVEGYPKIEFVKDLVNECEKDIRGCFAAGASRVSIDFTEGRLACKNDSRNPWTGAGLLPTFIDLINQVLDRFTAEERGNIGLHTCPGGDCDSAHSAEVPYNALLPALFSVNAGYFLVQAASEADKDKETLYEEIGRRLRRDANGVKQVVFIGVVKTLNPRVETAEEICDALVAASRYIPKDQLGATDDCGFSPFASDSKPLHGGNPDFAREVALKKIAARVEGARMASEKLGI